MSPCILIADPVDASGLDLLRQSGAEVRLVTDDEHPRLAELLPGFDALVVRSRTRVTREMLAAGTDLRVVGRAGIGVDNVDVAAATEMGILVVNAPTGNLLSATEHTFALLLALARNLPAADASVKAGEWDRKRFLGLELDGKTLGVVGFGRIGRAVAARARGFGMKVVAHDPYLDPAAGKPLEVELLGLDELLAVADVVTLHMPMTDETRNLINADRVRSMKEGAILVNCARGGLVDETALLESLEEGRLAGAALDVFTEEPPTDLRLVGHPRVVATPHIGAQTREAQERVATQTARMVLSALDGSLTVTAVNLPFTSAGVKGEPFLALGEQLGRLAWGLLGGSLTRIEIDLWGVEEDLRTPISVAAVKGALDSFMGDGVNYVNAESVATGRGIQVQHNVHAESGEYPHLIGVTLASDGGGVSLAGTVFNENDLRVVRLDEHRLEFSPKGRLLVMRNKDVPGVVGKFGSLLGDARVNIADIHLARLQEGGGGAVVVIRIDNEPGKAVLADLGRLDEVDDVRLVDLG